jgi:hypothetical protein
VDGKKAGELCLVEIESLSTNHNMSSPVTVCRGCRDSSHRGIIFADRRHHRPYSVNLNDRARRDFVGDDMRKVRWS